MDGKIGSKESVLAAYSEDKSYKKYSIDEWYRNIFFNDLAKDVNNISKVRDKF